MSSKLAPQFSKLKKISVVLVCARLVLSCAANRIAITQKTTEKLIKNPNKAQHRNFVGMKKMVVLDCACLVLTCAIN